MAVVLSRKGGGSGSGGAPSGAAGGDLAGTYPNPTIAPNSVAAAEIDGADAAAIRTELDVPSNAQAILDTIVDAKGDIIAATGADTVARLVVGANDLLLVADSAQATGLKWAGAYAAFTPTWTSTGTAPAIGDSTVVARYTKVGKLVMCSVTITFGGTATFGTGNYRFAPPVVIAQRAIGAIWAVDTGTAVRTGTLLADNNNVFRLFTNDAAVADEYSNTVPHTWAATDVLEFSASYETT